ncbi:hypothetical protein C8F04DRAFT_1184857 [Mycena alexandri]|uniref:Uncharacterized protein n=1 Tax=Mycena alexandri TaxID=1745969 RepID=A0AAD6ST88_9AGAR|nr:hypothetical protein C8F04DRAFT_1184857 [Mycena alexandri]
MTQQHRGHVLAIRILSELYQGLPLAQGQATENSQSVSVPSLLPLVLGIAWLDAEGYQPTIVQFKLSKRCKAGAVGCEEQNEKRNETNYVHFLVQFARRIGEVKAVKTTDSGTDSDADSGADSEARIGARIDQKPESV